MSRPPRVPYAMPDEVELPGRRGYVVVSDDLQTRLDTAARRVVEAKTQDEREAAEAECVAVWQEIDAHEQDERDAEEERRLDSMMSREDELR